RAQHNMASFPNLWPHRPSDSSEGSRTFRRRLVIAALVLAASVIAFALSELATQGNHAMRSTPDFLTRGLGPTQPSAPLVRKPAHGVTVRIAKDGLAFTQNGNAVHLVGAKPPHTGWTRHVNGASRKTPFGTQAIVFDDTRGGAEEYLVVDKRQGTHTWRWRLDTTMTPRTTPAGVVGFADGHRIDDSYIPAVKILDGQGNDVTPKGAAWTTVKRADTWWLELRLNDKHLSLPYTIDPAVLRIIGTLAVITGAGTTLSVSAPPTARAQDLLILHYAQASATVPGCPTGWNVLKNSANTTSGVTTNGLGSIECWKDAVAGDVGAAVSLTRVSAASAAAVITAYKGVDTSQVGTGAPGATSPIQQAATAASTAVAATSVTFPALSATTAIANEEVVAFGARVANDSWATATNYTLRSAAVGGTTGISVGVYDRNVAVAGGTVAAQATAAMSTSVRSTSFTFALTNDTAAPAAIGEVLATNPTGSAYQASPGSAIFYNSNAGGTLTLSTPFTDTESAPDSVTYPALAANGWTHTLETPTTAPNFTSSTFTWAAAATTPALSLTQTDSGGNATANAVTLTPDGTAPTGGAFSANGTAASGGVGTSSYLTSGTTLTINSRTDWAETVSGAASGLKTSTLTIETAPLTANSCGVYGAPVTIVGIAAQTVASGNCYRLVLTGLDQVNNTATITTVVKVDTTNPSAPASFSFTGLSANAYWPGAGSVLYFQPGIAGSFTVTGSGAADADTGIASYGYGAVGGTGWSNAAGAYTYTTASTTGTGSVTATNGAGLVGSGTSFTAQADANLPISGAFTANSVAATGPGSTSYINAGTTLTINSRTDFTEAQDATHSGLGSSTLTMATGTLSGNACSAYGAPATIVGTTAQTVATAKCYLLTLTGTDNVGNAATVSTTVKVDSTTPSAPSATGFSFSALSNAYWPGGVSATVYLKSGSAGGFTTSASGATDGDSGIASYTYGAVAGTGWSNAAGVYSFGATSPTGTGAVTATNNAGLTGSSTSFNAVSDGNLPTSGAFTANGTAATGPGSSSYLSAGTTLTLSGRTDYTEVQDATHSGLASSTLTMQTGTLSNNSCSAYGAPATIVGVTSQTVASGFCYLLTLTGTDHVGNAATVSTTVKVDTTAPPAPSGFNFSAVTNAFAPAGSTVYIKSGATGGFTVAGTGSTDTETGAPASFNYGAVAGTGWSNASGVYSFGATSPTGTGAVTATNNAGLTGSATNFTAVSDGNLPISGAFTANGTAASGPGTSSYVTAGTTLTINSRTDFTETQDATHSGLASSTLTMQTGSLSGNVCSGYGAPSTIVGTTSQTVASGNCYLLTLAGTDNVGNATTVQTTVKVDTTLPTAPTSWVFSAPTHAYAPSGGSTVYLKNGAVGGFTVTASGSTDGDTGISSYNYGAIAGTGWSNAAGVYSFGATSPTGTGATSATNNAGVTGSTANITAVSDGNVPISGAFTANGTAASGPGTTSYLNAGTTLTLSGRTDFTEAQDATHSGLASSTLTMATGTLSNGSCSGYGAPATIVGITSQTVASGNCYLLTLTGTDNVGNATSVSTTVKVDTTAPSAPSASGFTFGSLTNAYWPGGSSATVYVKDGSTGGFTVSASGSTDADTGVSSYAYGAVAGTG
ncbi:MAG: hypothetical protein QOF28_3335, partial [Actinomycetota bacterium]|nr:hypothetical protein [Actinomycetota bacterium]